MKRALSLLCTLALVIQPISLTVSAEEIGVQVVSLPRAIQYVEEESFQGDASIQSVFIPAGFSGIPTLPFHSAVNGCSGSAETAIRSG